MIEVVARIGRYEDTFTEKQFSEAAAVRSAADPIAACKKAIKSAKLSYARFSGTPRMGLWYEARIQVLESLLTELQNNH